MRRLSILALSWACQAPSGEPEPETVTCTEDRGEGSTEALELGPEWRQQAPVESPVRGAGLAVADFTGDGRPDIFLANDTPCQLFVQLEDGTVRDETATRLPDPTADCHAWGASAADADGDGDLDLYVVRDSARDGLYLNDGSGHFVDHTDAAGLPDLACGSRTASWADVDGDGDLDVFVARHHALRSREADCPQGEAPQSWTRTAGDPNSLLLNQGDATFIDASDRLPPEAAVAFSFIGGWVDVDLDLDPDLVMVNDFGNASAHTAVWINDGTGHFTRVPESSGGALRIFGMGVAMGDLNGDGLPELALTDIEDLHLLTSLGDTSWYDDAARARLISSPERHQCSSWGVSMEDVDNDGLLDLYVAYGPTEVMLRSPDDPCHHQPDALFLGQPDGTFIDRAPEWGVDDDSTGRSTVVTDFDGDGWLDFFRPDYRGGPVIARRQRCGQAAWLQVTLDAPLQGHGARIELEAGGQLQTRWMFPSGHGLAASAPAVAHFGLGEVEQVDTLTVYWPDGTVTEAHHIDARQRITLGHGHLR